MRLSDDARNQTDENQGRRKSDNRHTTKKRSASAHKPMGAMAQAFDRLKK
jgi:hypothetical protein